jgi:hypothetical protein
MRWKCYLRSSDPRFGISAKMSEKTGSPQSSEYNLSRIEFLRLIYVGSFRSLET